MLVKYSSTRFWGDLPQGTNKGSISRLAGRNRWFAVHVYSFCLTDHSHQYSELTDDVRFRRETINQNKKGKMKYELGTRRISSKEDQALFIFSTLCYDTQATYYLISVSAWPSLYWNGIILCQWEQIRDRIALHDVAKGGQLYILDMVLKNGVTPNTLPARWEEFTANDGILSGCRERFYKRPATE